MKEHEVSMTELIVEVLLHWRTMIIIMVLGGLFFGGFSYVRSYKQTQDAGLKEELMDQDDDLLIDDAEQIEKKLTSDQIGNVNTLIILEKRYEERKQYSETTIVTKTNPFKVPRAELTFHISTDDWEKTYNIVKIYEDFLTSTDLFEYIRENCKFVNEYNVNEMIALEKISSDQMTGSDVVRIVIHHFDEKNCVELSDCVLKYMEELNARLLDDLGPHKVDLLVQSFGNIMSTGYLDAQNNLRTELASYKVNICKLKENFSEEEDLYYRALMGIKDTPEEENAKKVESGGMGYVGISRKYVMMGMLLFMLLYVFKIIICYIFDNHLKATDNLRDKYDVPQLGMIPSINEKRVFGSVDKNIIALRNRNKRRFSEEDAIKLTATAIKIAAKKEALDEICLVGCDVKERSESVCNQIAKILNEDGIRTKILNNILYDAEAMADLEQVQGVVFVEKAGVTMYNEIDSELEIVARQKIEVLGGVIIE